MSATKETPAPEISGGGCAAGTGGGEGGGGSGRPGRLAEEYAALRRGCGLADLSSADGPDTMEMLGPDRHRFLNAYVTCEVKGLAAGPRTYGFFTSPPGPLPPDLGGLAPTARCWPELRRAR